MKARRDHRVPLSKAAVQLLQNLPRDPESDFVFISPMAKREPLSNMALLATLKRMDRSDLTAHGFRSTFRDWAAETTAYPDAVVEMALAHAIGNAVEAAYRRGDLFEKRKRLMADWASYCATASRQTADIVQIRR
jgi:integrase